MTDNIIVAFVDSYFDLMRDVYFLLPLQMYVVDLCIFLMGAKVILTKNYYLIASILSLFLQCPQGPGSMPFRPSRAPGPWLRLQRVLMQWDSPGALN